MLSGGESADFQHTVIGRGAPAWEAANYTQISDCVKVVTLRAAASEEVKKKKVIFCFLLLFFYISFFYYFFLYLVFVFYYYYFFDVSYL